MILFIIPTRTTRRLVMKQLIQLILKHRNFLLCSLTANHTTAPEIIFKAFSIISLSLVLLLLMLLLSAAISNFRALISFFFLWLCNFLCFDLFFFISFRCEFRKCFHNHFSSSSSIFLFFKLANEHLIQKMRKSLN